MNFRIIPKIFFFLIVFISIWTMNLGLEAAFASNDSSEKSLTSIEITDAGATLSNYVVLGDDEKETKRDEEIERIRTEIKRIKEEVERIKIEIERRGAEKIFLEKKASPEKITTPSEGTTAQLKRAEIEEIPQETVTEEIKEKPITDEIATEKTEKKSTDKQPTFLLSISKSNLSAAVGKIFESRKLSILFFLILTLLAIFSGWFVSKITKRKIKITSPIFFLLFGFLITILFTFIPLIYDPIIMNASKQIINKITEYKTTRVYVAAIIPVAISSGNELSETTKMPAEEKINTDKVFLSPFFKKEIQMASSIIKITWFVFILFFLLPIAIMLPLAWYERRKVRKTKRKIPNSPKVSLIFPAYNEEKLISKTIEQGLKQDYKGEIELIIIDDGSNDKTFEISQEFAKQHPNNIKVYKHKKNSGKPAALNTGFQKASGEISVFSDSDSHLYPDLVSKMMPHFDDPKVGVVAGMIVIDNEINLLTKLQQIEYLYNQEIIRFCQAVHKGVLICPGAATAVRTKIAREIPSTERTVTEDSDFTFEVAKAGWKVTQEPEAISMTEAPEDWKELINQRKRWLYGVLQTIWLHKWALFFKDSKTPNLWVWWAWIGYITCPITTLAIVVIPLFTWLIGIRYLIFLGFYSFLVGIIFCFAHWYGLKEYSYSNKTKLTFLLPLYLVYQYLLNLLLFYLVIAFMVRKGITVRYGGRYIHAV